MIRTTRTSARATWHATPIRLPSKFVASTCLHRFLRVAVATLRVVLVRTSRRTGKAPSEPANEQTKEALVICLNYYLSQTHTHRVRATFVLCTALQTDDTRIDSHSLHAFSVRRQTVSVIDQALLAKVPPVSHSRLYSSPLPPCLLVGLSVCLSLCPVVVVSFSLLCFVSVFVG